MYSRIPGHYYRTASAGLWLGFWLLFLCPFTPAWAFVEVPILSSRVTDLAGTFSAGQAQALESKLAAFEAKKGSQIAVLIVPTTQPEDIAEFGIKVADLWRIGRKGVDDGLILVIAKNDRKLRLEVGYGLEGVIPDAVAKRVIAETITPYFKNGDFVGGIDAGVDQIIGLIEGEQLPAPAQQGYSQQNEGGFIFLLFAGLFAGSLLSSMFGRATGGLVAGLGSGVIASLLLGFGIGAIMVGVIVFFLTSASHTGGGGGWSNGGGGYYRGGGGGGSWSGGGGGFGGGGASGSW
ncbi:TPM domain-containing protein [Methyloglobulus sp.]|uniref:TPM domain-containing protein n=1 Tax=Methyloglobulus sp. TaxID=2518622 RepID=UPI00398976EE